MYDEAAQRKGFEPIRFGSFRFLTAQIVEVARPAIVRRKVEYQRTRRGG
jgi:hypothetical protein